MFRFHSYPGVEEGLAPGHVLDVFRHHAVAMQHGVLVLAEVIANRPDHADIGEVARGRKNAGGATESALSSPRSLDRVEGDQTDH